MSNKQFTRKYKEDKPVIAICYDFDKTLTPDDMQAQGFIQSVGNDVEEFWKESNALAGDNDMDQNLAYMYLMKEKAYGRVLFNRQQLFDYGSKITLFPGVEEWFDRIREYGKKHGAIVEHYIISSGLREMIEGTSVARNGAFERIYASSFYYDEGGMAVWPAQAVNYTNKTQFLFRIEKGVLDVNDPGVNESFQPGEIRVPFRNMIYIGDSDTDIPCMSLVNSRGGSSIGVYGSEKLDKTKVYKMMHEGRIRYYAAADYSEGKELDRIVKSIIDRTIVESELDNIHYACKSETDAYDRENSESGRKKIDLINSLRNSGSFAETHTIISRLTPITDWDKSEREELCEVALRNGQVLLILGDPDVRAFYEKLLRGSKSPGKAAQDVLFRINNSEKKNRALRSSSHKRPSARNGGPDR